MTFASDDNGSPELSPANWLFVGDIERRAVGIGGRIESDVDTTGNVAFGLDGKTRGWGLRQGALLPKEVYAAHKFLTRKIPLV